MPISPAIACCGVNCAACADFLNKTCPGCRQTEWGEDPCMPVKCCREQGIEHCGACPTFLCADMKAFFGESDGHREAYARLCALRDNAENA